MSSQRDDNSGVTVRWALLAIVPLLASTAWAGIVVETVERNAKTGVERSTSTLRAQGGLARIDGGPRGGVVILKDDAIYIVDTQRKSYSVMDSAALERTMGAMNAMMEQMRAQMANLPPEQRAAMENMLKQNGVSLSGNAPPASYQVKATGATEKAAGLTCKVMDVVRNGELWQQLCVVPNAALPGRDEFQAVAKRMRALFEKMGAMAQQFMGGALQAEEALAAKIDGVPVITRSYRNGTLDGTEMVIKSWQSTNVTADAFEVPAGYTKQEMPTLPAR